MNGQEVTSAASVGSRPIRVTHITTNHQPFDSRIFLKECISLAEAGYAVKLVVPHTEDLVKEGVHIVSYDRPKNRRERFLRSGWDALRTALATEGEIFHLHDPDLLPVGWILKVMGKRVIYDAHEDRPKQILSKQWIPKVFRPYVAVTVRAAEFLSATMFDRIVAATPSIAKTFPRKKTTLLQNYPIVGELLSADSQPFEMRPNQVIFVGGMTSIRGVKEFVDAMTLVPSDLGAKLVLVGSFDSPAFQAEVESSPGWKLVQAMGWQDRTSVARLLGASRIGLVTYLPEPNHIAAQPNKLFEYMSAGVPVVASDFPLWRTLIEDAGCGLLVNPAEPEQIAEAISWLLSHPDQAAQMGRRGQEAVLERLNWETESRSLKGLYATISQHVS